MKNLLLLLIVVLSSCVSSNDRSKRTSNIDIENFNISRYKGYVIKSKIPDSWADRDYYVIKGDSFAVEIRTPSWFDNIYDIGDTIK